MTYNDIATPIRKTLYGEADTIYTFLTAHHGKIDAIAKGIRKPTSRKRGNIDFGVFSDIQFAKGKNMDTVIEAQIVSFNDDLLMQKGLKYIFAVLPLLNKFTTDAEHSNRVFSFVVDNFMKFDNDNPIYSEVNLKFFLLDNQNMLPDVNTCYLCRVKYDNLENYSIKNKSLICNNCARKTECYTYEMPEKIELINIENRKDLEILLNILNSQLEEIFPKFKLDALHNRV